VKWSFETTGLVNSSPAIGQDGIIYIGSWGDCLYAINPDSTLQWKFHAGSNIRSSPAIGQDGTIYFGSWDHYLYALPGSSKWAYQDYQSSMKAYAKSNWPKFGQNNYNLHRVPTFKKSLPVTQFMKILGLDKEE